MTPLCTLLKSGSDVLVQTFTVLVYRPSFLGYNILLLGVQFKVCHGSLYAVMWLADAPREFNLPTLPQRCITYEAEKLPSKYGVHSEEYVPACYCYYCYSYYYYYYDSYSYSY
ncbi:hypothetical protein ANN_08338 [Periplaneta americana]|uniref:Uncharacterized protein n=1 Tax=Periplaneta americana TaxID=6978 RepID=A0ABQ8T157_PERAM|nr:hypothetical protein ANN_08338 [Periplaneta americana]